MNLITASQIGAAHPIVRWNAEDIARRAKLGAPTGRRWESADREPGMPLAKVAAIQRALEVAGIEFTDGGASAIRVKASR